MFKIDRNPNIPVATIKGHWFSRLSSRSVCIALLSLEEISDMSLVHRQEYRHHGTNTSFEGSFLP